jgi:hypothetical protein
VCWEVTISINISRAFFHPLIPIQILFTSLNFLILFFRFLFVLEGSKAFTEESRRRQRFQSYPRHENQVRILFHFCPTLLYSFLHYSSSLHFSSLFFSYSPNVSFLFLSTPLLFLSLLNTLLHFFSLLFNYFTLSSSLSSSTG